MVINHEFCYQDREAKPYDENKKRSSTNVAALTGCLHAEECK
ncbi:hypothetical protein T11_3523 [Trichinella zimbabwensis]|uniref:Uncharacterized protein n=1 Tax=Trichinella zimbabwensis TaxID=268475 RepID=A0A0V1G1C2_9BILA|nr:hypothetical protein T11_3523 [Trichinella zimbabwensis]